MSKFVYAVSAIAVMSVPAAAEEICFIEKYPEGGSAAMSIKYQNDPGNRYMVISQTVPKKNTTYYGVARCSKASGTEASCVLDCSKDVVTMDFSEQPAFYLKTNGMTLATNPNAACGERDAVKVAGSNGRTHIQFFQAEPALCN